jgi:hypothetical protein
MNFIDSIRQLSDSIFVVESALNSLFITHPVNRPTSSAERRSPVACSNRDIEQTKPYSLQRASPSFARAYRSILVTCEWFKQFSVLTAMGKAEH